jgi:hypothetical protein
MSALGNKIDGRAQFHCNGRDDVSCRQSEGDLIRNRHDLKGIEQPRMAVVIVVIQQETGRSAGWMRGDAKPVSVYHDAIVVAVVDVLKLGEAQSLHEYQTHQNCPGATHSLNSLHNSFFPLPFLDPEVNCGKNQQRKSRRSDQTADHDGSQRPLYFRAGAVG